MTLLPNVRIGTRLAIGFAMVLGLTIVSTAAALVSARDNAEATRRMMQSPVAKERLISDWYVLTYSAIARTSMIAKTTDETLPVTFAEVISDSVKRGSETMAKVEALLVTDGEKQTYKSIVELRAKYQAAKDVVGKAKAGGNAAETERVFKDAFQPAAKAYESRVLDLLSMERQAIDDMSRAIDEANARSFSLTLALGVLTVLVGSLFAWLITRSITRPIDKAVKVAQTVAAGDLSARIEIESRDETGQLMQALKHMNDSLAKVVGEVRTGTNTIATASGQIATGNHDLSSRTEEQASSLEQTAASMEELSSTVKQNAQGARQARDMAVRTREHAEEGRAIAGSAVDAMDAITQASREVGEIVAMIDELAFQTNLLALNAAVEAARAGDQGRGFAVVATEVRNLAQRSGAAAKNIKSLIQYTTEKVFEGATLVQRTGDALHHIAGGVREVTTIIEIITAASEQQAAGIGQVNTAVMTLDQVTQQNAALVEQASAASRNTLDLSQALVNQVAFFSLQGQPGSRR